MLPVRNIAHNYNLSPHKDMCANTFQVTNIIFVGDYR